MDVKYLFKQHIRAGYTEKQALRGCLSIINTLENYVENYPNIEIYFLEHVLGLDIMLTEERSPTEFFMFMRDENLLIIGGVYIQSKPTAEIAKSHFLSTCQRGIRIEESNLDKIFKKIKKDLRHFEEPKKKEIK
jgi:hypothetical protein